jgi:hypothetical protein
LAWSLLCWIWLWLFWIFSWFLIAWYSFLYPWTFRVCVTAWFWGVLSCRQQRVGTILKIQPSDLCLLIGELKPFKFRVIMEMYVLIPEILGGFVLVNMNVLCSFVLLIHICWGTKLNMFNSFLLICLSIPLMKFILSWVDLMFITVFLLLFHAEFL